MNSDSPDEQWTSGKKRRWWKRLRNWLSSTLESPGRLTRRIDDPPDWSPDPRRDRD